jgi:hypothetical protein
VCRHLGDRGGSRRDRARTRRRTSSRVPHRPRRDDPAPVEVGGRSWTRPRRCTNAVPDGTTGSAGRSRRRRRGGDERSDGRRIRHDRQLGQRAVRGVDRPRCSIAGGSASVRGSGVAPRTGPPGSGSATERWATGGPSTASAASVPRNRCRPQRDHRGVGPVEDGTEEPDDTEPTGGTPTAADPTSASRTGRADGATGGVDDPSDRCTTVGAPSSGPAGCPSEPESPAADSAVCRAVLPGGFEPHLRAAPGGWRIPAATAWSAGQRHPATGSSATPGGPGVASTIPTADPDGAPTAPGR